MDVTLQQLRAVTAVHDMGGFTAAATSLHVAQPSLSRTVADVERRLGVPLFTRTTRRFETTPAGLEFVGAARRVLDGFDEEMRRFADHLAGTRGRVRIATLPSLAALLLPGVVAAFRAEHPDVDLTLSDALAEEVVDRVRSRRAELAVTVVSVAADLLEDLEVRPVAEDRFCALLPPGHHLADRDRLGWAELAQESFIDFDPTTSIRHHVDHAFATADARPHRVVAARNISAVAGLVAAGLGVTAVPGLVVPLTQFAGLIAVPLDGPVVVRRMALVRGEVASPAAGAFADLLIAGGDRPTLPPFADWLTARPRR
jgi:LysR family carnitine catabolism transcriptional activator